MTFAKSGAEIWRDYVTDGVPASGVSQPSKPDIRAWAGEVERSITSQVLAAGGGLYDTLVDLEADLSPADLSPAWVYADATAANNGIYRKNGAADAGSWDRVLDLPFSVIPVTISNADGDAIVGTTALPVPAADMGAILIMTPAADNTGAVTIALNGEAAAALTGQDAAAMQAGYLQAGSVIAFFKLGAGYRTLNDFRVPALAAQVEADAATASLAKDLAIDAAVSTGADSAAAIAAAATAIGAAESAGVASYYDTKADAESALSGLSENDIVEVIADEDYNGRRTRYRVESAALVFKTYLDVDGVQPEKVTHLRPLTARVGRPFDVVSELTDPSLASNKHRRVIVLGGAAPIEAYCDGVTWWDITNGAEIDPWWLPRGASLHCDFENGRFYWGGAEKVIGDLTNVSGVSYYIDHNMGVTGGEATVVLEWEPTSAGADENNAQFAGTLFSWTTGYPSGNRFEFTVQNNATYGDSINIYMNPATPSANYVGLGTASKVGEGGARRVGLDRHRNVCALKSATDLITAVDNGEVKNPGSPTYQPGTISAPTRVGFSCRAWAPGAPDNLMTDCTLHRVTVYSTKLGVPHIEAIGSSGAHPPVHFLGDSFLNLYGTARAFEHRLKADSYVGFSQDGVGGTTLTQQAVRYASYNSAQVKWLDATLFILDMGREEPENAIAAIKTILGLITHNRWAYVEPAPSSPPPASYFATNAAIRAFCGDDHYCATHALAMAASDLSPEDEARVAVGMWPLSLVTSDVDFHPNFAGQDFLAGVCYDFAVAQGWAA